MLVEANPRIMGGILPAVYQCAAGESSYRAEKALGIELMRGEYDDDL